MSKIGKSKTVSVHGKEKSFESGRFYSDNYIIKHTFVPKPSKCPEILYFAGPTRSGTSAFAALMTCIPEIDKSYYQPHKNIRRHGRQLILHPNDKLVAMKETFGPLHNEELFDPINMMLSAGVPKEKLHIVITLRDPIKNFASLTKLSDRVNPIFYKKIQAHTINLYNKYKSKGFRIVPFVYDLFGSKFGEKAILDRLLLKSGIKLKSNYSLQFDNDKILKKLVLGEAEIPDFYETYIKSVTNKACFKYTNNSIKLPTKTVKILNDMCMVNYLNFKKETQRLLEINGD